MNGSLLLSVSDNGVGLKDIDISAIPEGVGLRNTKARLRHLYGNAHQFELTPEEKGGVTLKLKIPYKKTDKGYQQTNTKGHEIFLEN